MHKPKKEVIKHSAAIHIQNNISLLQRRAWNVLLANAYDDLPTEERHRIRVKDLMQVLEFDSKNEAHLKEALKALTTCGVEWNILDKDGEQEWGVTTLLAEAVIKRGTCAYAYGPTLRERLHNPRMYARISLSMQNKFVSKHAQALWELCVDYLDESRNYGETPFIPLEEYRKLMGISEDMYPEFKKLNKWVIKDPVTEINKVTDFQVSVDYQREHRKVAAVKFKVRRVLELPGPMVQQGVLFPDYEDAPMVWELKTAGLSAEEAWKIWQQGFESVRPDKRPESMEFETYLREKLDLLKRRKAEGKVNSATGFLLKAIQENYSNAEFAEAERRKSAQQQQRQAKRQEATKVTLERERDDALHALCHQLFEATPALAEEAAQFLLAGNALFKQQYRSDKDPLENYQARPLLWIEMDRYLRQQHPEHFREVLAHYDTRLRALEPKAA